jgi:hypothetical protein
VPHTQRDFLHAVLAHSGLPCIAYKRPGKSGMQHKVTATIDDALAYMEPRVSDGYDYYFAISTLAEESVRDDDGHVRVRTQTNCAYTRCFILDIDVHSEKPEQFYATQDEAREGVQNICGALGMPTPIVVNSGYGLHVYWPMAEGVPSHEWKRVAEQFKRVLSLVEPKAVGDGTRVADSASVLRLPGTLNLKNGAAMPVEVESWSDEILDFGEFAKQMQSRSGTPATVKPKGMQRAVPTVSLEIARDEMEPVTLLSLAKNCRWTRNYLHMQADADEPQWYAMLGLAPYVVHTGKDGTLLAGIEVAKLFSSQHPEYDAHYTEKKYSQVAAAQSGPTTCARFQALYRPGCEGCPFLGAVKSPISAARLSLPITEPKAVEATLITESGEAVQATVHIPVPPKPYFRGEDGGVYVRARVEQDDGSWADEIQRIYDYDLYPTRRFRTENMETETLECRLHLPMDGVRTFKLPTELLADMKKLNQYLCSRGVVAEAGKAKGITKYMIDYVRDMQVNHAAETEFSRFGWRDTATDNPKFVVGNGYISKDAPLTRASFAYFLQKASLAVACAGELKPWKEAFDVYKGIPESEPYQIALLMGFAAPLLAHTGYKGVLYNMVGASGAGKSTALQLMSSVWGQPDEHHLRAGDNEIPTYNTIGYLNAIPVAFDELTLMEPDKLGRFVLNFTAGRGKMRAMRNGANALNEVEWDTIVVGSSNTSLYTKLAENRVGYTAEAMRVYEVDVPTPHEDLKPMVARATAALKQNYGLAGRVYMEWLIPRLPQVRVALAKSMERIDATGQRRVDERFWVALIAALEVGGAIAYRLGLHGYDVPHLVRWATGKSDQVRKDIDSAHASPVDVLSDYFNATLDGTLRFAEGGSDLTSIETHIRTVKNRIECTGVTPQRAFISVAAVKEYCKYRKIDISWLKKGLEMDKVLLTTQSKRLATGTTLSNSPTRAWEIDMTHPKLTSAGEVPE